MPSIDMTKLTILVIDDEPFMRSLVERVLFELGVRNVLNAENGADGLRTLRTRKRVDVIVCDLEMPTMNGFDFVRALRDDPDRQMASIPVVILTGHSEEEAVREAVGLGISGFIVKPISKGGLESRIVAALTKPPIDRRALDTR